MAIDKALRDAASEAGRAWGATRVTESHKCPECEVTFEAIKKAIYCSNRCRQRAKYRRVQEARDGPA